MPFPMTIFQTKKTEFHPQGDNIYYCLENKIFKQTPNPNHNKDNLAKELDSVKERGM